MRDGELFDSKNKAHDRINSTKSYPQFRLETRYNLPIELIIYSYLPQGSADAEIAYSHAMQLEHPTYTDIFFEASAKVMNTSFRDDEKTAVYTFLVGENDLEFHRHEGHRIIMGTVGSGGAYFRFSDAFPEEEVNDPLEFIKRMKIIEMPPDCRFILRFSGKVYHQFGPKDVSSPAVYAVSVHPDEAAGLEGELLNRILSDDASIPILTQPLSERTQHALKDSMLVQTYAEFIKIEHPLRKREISVEDTTFNYGEGDMPIGWRDSR